jgi:hypothetical protein
MLNSTLPEGELLYVVVSIYDHVWWVPCHRGTARPQVADGEDGFQIERVAPNISTKESRISDKGWSSSLGVGLTTPHHKI